MKIVNIIGGLGNQMFQYAFFLALKKEYFNEEIKLYNGVFNGYNVHTGYELERVFGIKVEQATKNEILKYAYPYFNYRLWQIGFHLLPQRKSMLNEKIYGRYYVEAFNKKGNCYYDGYWQNERYFLHIRSEIFKAFTPINVDEKNRQMAIKLASCESVSIHVRRGDFLKKKIYKGICDIDYYKRAISLISQEKQINAFCIFSNNIEWCKENILPLFDGRNVFIVDWNAKENAYLDMYLMSNCHHNIIANSSFSWWGAWLNQHIDKIVIAPRIWNNIKDSEFELPPSWIKI